MTPTRREFVKGSVGLLGAAALGGAGLSPRVLRAAAAPLAEGAAGAAGGTPTLVVLYLRGGADPLNTIVPYGDELYQSLRPTIGLSPGKTPAGPGLLTLDHYWGFHPATAPLGRLYQNKLFAPILSTGSTHPTRSHFDAQDFMERAAPGVRNVTEGWLNRYLTATGGADASGDSDLRAVSLQPTLPRSLRGEYPVLAVPDYGAERAMDAFERLYSCKDHEEAKEAAGGGAGGGKGGGAAPVKAQPGDSMRERIVEAGATGIEKLRKLNKILEQQGERDNARLAEAGDEAMRMAVREWRTGDGDPDRVVEAMGPAKYPESLLGRQMADTARLIRAEVGVEIVALDYNGWDHHAYQGGTTGTMADMLGNVSRSLAAFHDDLGESRMRNVLVLAMSEFGRTVAENGTNGTDHGRGGFMMAMGGPVQGGRFYGNWTGLDKRTLIDGRDLPIHVDFRDVFGETLWNLFGFRADKEDFFPGYRANGKPLGFLKGLA